MKRCDLSAEEALEALALALEARNEQRARALAAHLEGLCDREGVLSTRPIVLGPLLAVLGGARPAHERLRRAARVFVEDMWSPATATREEAISELRRAYLDAPPSPLRTAAEHALGHLGADDGPRRQAIETLACAVEVAS